MKGLRVQGTKGSCGDQGEKGPWADEGPNSIVEAGSWADEGPKGTRDQGQMWGPRREGTMGR